MGQAVVKPTPGKLIRKGLCYVPQGHRVFPNLTVAENIQLSGAGQGSVAADAAKLLDEFPFLKARMKNLGGTLSGGEKQALALLCALIRKPRVLLLDEPSLGLAPAAFARMFEYIRELCTKTGTAVVLAEQRVRSALEIADSAMVLRAGSTTYTGPATALLEHSERLREVYF